MTGPSAARGVLLANLGTPSAPTPESVRAYLDEFLSDPLVLTMPAPLRTLLLRALILPRRSAPVAEKYAQIWDRHRAASPLLALTFCQASELAKRLASDSIAVATAMRYGAPSIRAGLETLERRGVERILTLGLYPQENAASTGTLKREVQRQAGELPRPVPVSFTPPWYEEKEYIRLLAARIGSAIESAEVRPERLLVSFHGVPRRVVERGDPYRDQCEATFAALKEALRAGENPALAELQPELCYQSRFGPAWLKPFASERAKTLARSGCRALAVTTPGFATDCLETLEEIGAELRDTFLDNGGAHFLRVPCLNSSAEHMDFLAGLVRRNLA